MDSDNSPSGREAVSRSRYRSGTLDARVVLVADGDPAVTDDLAAVLREDYTVRTAYDSADALASLDASVGVALLDPGLPGLSARHVLDRVTGEAVDCQVAALVADSESAVEGTDFDATLAKPVDSDDLRETVDRLSRRAAYRTALEEYFALAERHAALSPDDPEHDRVHERLTDLRADLADIYCSLDTREAYDAALRELRHDS